MLYASAVFGPETVARVIDEPAWPGSERRVTTIRFDDMMHLHIGGEVSSSDEQIVAGGELLIAAVRELVDAARARIAAAEPCEPDGPPDSYWAAPDDSAHRAQMRDAGRAVA